MGPCRACGVCCSGDNSANFIVGLTNVHPLINNPQPGNYDVCGQYPGIVPKGATVKLTCNDPDLPPARYVIVQFPKPDSHRVIFCEVEVFTPEGRCPFISPNFNLPNPKSPRVRVRVRVYRVKARVRTRVRFRVKVKAIGLG